MSRHRQDLTAEAAQHLPGRSAVQTPGKVPQGAVHKTDQPDRELLCPVKLPHPVPYPLTLERICPNKLLAKRDAPRSPRGRHPSRDIA